jgi:signal transduction histidine kinase
MSASNVLMVTPRRPTRADFGADFAASLREARDYLKAHAPAVLVFGADTDFEDFCRFAAEQAPDCRWIVSCDGLPPTRLLECSNSGHLHDLIDDFDDPELERKLRSALESAGERIQKRELVELFEDQSERLTRLQADLEARVQKRQKTLGKSNRRLEDTGVRLSAFHQAVLGIHRASTVLQMEQTLNEALRGTIEIEWVRVRFEAQSLLNRQTGAHVLAIELPFQFEKSRGEVLFGKTEGKRFTSEETDFLYEVSEALALALARLQKLEQAETLKGQWQATFDSIPHPLCLVNDKMEILKLNRAFQHACGDRDFNALIGKNGFEVFFGPGFKPQIALESPFTFRQARVGPQGTEYFVTEHFEVSGQKLGLARDNAAVQLLLLRPITDEVRFERRLVDAAKLAELGTIGSSIAHELNNPLGGMLSFLQLILMDLKKADPIHDEVKAMEEATLRCRDIVQNLLSFARKPDLGDLAPADLRTVVGQSIKLIELQSRSKGIVIDSSALDARPAVVKASANTLSQALCNLLQNAIDAVLARQSAEPDLDGRITLRLESDHDQYHLQLSDNGTGIAPEIQSQIFNPLFTTRDPERHGGMGLTTAFTIISDHRGKLEILSQTGVGTTAVISLPKLDESPESSGF